MELRYDPETGHFFRDHKRADTPRRDGYARVTLDDGRRMLAHRAAFTFMTGSEAAGFVDHVNCDRGDNRWANLRTSGEPIRCGQWRSEHRTETGSVQPRTEESA